MKRLVGLTLVLAACGGAGVKEDRMVLENGVRAVSTETLAAKRARYADVEISVPEASLSPEDRVVLKAAVRAADAMHRAFWKQVREDGISWRNEIWRISTAPDAGPHWRKLVDYIDLNVGPWDRLDGDEPFYGDRKKPDGAAFYPADLAKDEFERWVTAHPADREAFESPFTVIRRQGGGLVALPFSKVYADELDDAAKWLRAAADATKDTSLRRFLNSRADAFGTDDYFQSDMDWMDLGTAEGPSASAVEVAIGPYEVYEDGLFNQKAAFEAFLAVRDADESRKLATVAKHLDELEANLPLDDRHKNFSRGKDSPIQVVNVVYTSGDANKGVQTTAFNLPNDERVRAAKGSKKVMLKNVGEAKFNNSLIPIAKIVVDPALLPLITFDAYFNDILMHEVSHGLGPGFITMPDGTRKTVNQALKETYSHLEECKADVLGVYNTLALIRLGVFPADLGPKTEASYLAGIFRSVRFGIDEAHGKANIMEFNYLRGLGVFTFDPATGWFGIDHDRFADGIKALAHDLLTIQAAGDYDGAVKFLQKYGNMPQEVTDALARLAHVPVDIRPHYTLGERLLKEKM